MQLKKCPPKEQKDKERKNRRENSKEARGLNQKAQFPTKECTITKEERKQRG